MKTFIYLAFTGCIFCNSVIGQESQSSSSKFKIEVKTIDSFTMVYYENLGAYNDAFNRFGELINFIQHNNLLPGTFSVGIYYDDPLLVSAEKLRSEIGMPIKGETLTDSVFKFKTIASGKAVCVRYTSFDDIYPAYEALGNYITEKQLKTAPYSIELYYSNDPAVVDAEIIFLIE